MCPQNSNAHALRRLSRMILSSHPLLILAFRDSGNTLDGVTVDATSVVLNCRIGGGNIGPGDAEPPALHQHDDSNKQAPVWCHSSDTSGQAVCWSMSLRPP